MNYNLTFFIFLLFLMSCSSKSSLIQVNESEKESSHLIQTKAETDFESRFLLFLPEDYNLKDKWPLMLFLHGAGERGSDLDKVAVHGPPKLARQGKLQEFIIIAPQCPKGDYWDSHQQQSNLIHLLNTAEKELKVDSDKIYITGLSMGGFGTWELTANLHHRIAAAAPVCGGGSVWNSRLLKKVPIWAFHGAKDDIVPPELSEEMVEAVNEKGGNARLTIFPNANHNSWDPAYDTDELYKWLLEQNLQNRNSGE